MGRLFAPLVLAELLIACSGLSDVRDNLNMQRELFGLELVQGESCRAVAAGFDGYVELVVATPHWAIITASECRTLQAHLDAFNAVCEAETYEVSEEAIQVCSALDAWR